MEAKKKIILYSADWCVPCVQLKAHLDDMLKGKEKDVELIIVDIDKDKLREEDRPYIVPKVCLITTDDKKCDGVANCEEGYSTALLEKIKKFIGD